MEVAEALEILWIQVYGNCPTEMPTPSTSYNVSFIVMKEEDNLGLDHPMNLVLFLPKEETIEGTEDLTSMPMNEWKEVLVGDFITPSDHMSRDMGICMLQVHEHMMTGLVINKIIIRPVAKDRKELSGEDKWYGLLDPHNVGLNKFITGYDERLDAINDCIIKDENAPGYGLPMHEEKDFFFLKSVQTKEKQ